MNADMIDFMVRVSRTEAAGEAAAAGLMFREGISPDSRHVALVVNSDGQVYMRERTQPGQASVLTNIGGPHENPYPVWLRLIRVGSVFQAYRSSDGNNWTLVATKTNDMSRSAPFGLVTLGSVSIPNKAFFDNAFAAGADY